MSCGRKLAARSRQFVPVIPALRKVLTVFIAVALLLAPYLALAQTVKVLARITPQDGHISDAAVLDNSHLVLLYPEAGQIADYSLDGKLYQHIVREAGAESRFTPTFCAVAPDGKLLVFDETAHKLFTITEDGNIVSGVDLAYPASESDVLALSRIGGLSVDAAGLVWVVLPERGVLAGFDIEGTYQASVDLAGLLPYSGAVYTRAQWLKDGSLYALDYHQGAVLYRSAGETHFHLVKMQSPAGLDAAPLAQDFAVDDAGNILFITSAEGPQLLLLTPGKQGYESHAVEIKLPTGAKRLACCHSQGRFIVWSRDKPLVCVLELR